MTIATALVGARVTWKHLDDQGNPVVDLKDAHLVSFQRAGTPAAWSVLVLNRDGELRDVGIADVVVTDPEDSDIWGEIRMARVEAARRERGEPSAADEEQVALDGLERFLAEHFADVEDAGGGPIERVEALLLEFKTELLEGARALANKTKALDELEKEATTMRRKLSDIEKRKAKSSPTS